jgi:hypothetical protein
MVLSGRTTVTVGTPEGPSSVIGEWFFELPPDEIFATSPLRSAATALELAAGVTMNLEMLTPRRVTFRRWIEASDGMFKNAGLSDLAFDIEPPLSATIVEEQARGFLSVLDRSGAIPEIGVAGETAVSGIGGQDEMRTGVVTLRALYEGVGMTVFLSTFTDVWMDPDIAGRPQLELCRRNAPRLRKTLELVSTVLKAEVQPADPTKYAVPTLTGLEALTYRR